MSNNLQRETFCTCKDKHEKHSFYADLYAQNPEVTGSCILAIIHFSNGSKVKFVVDCGLFQEQEHKELNDKFIFDSEEIEFLCVTHAHMDHIGRIPLLVNQGLDCPIYTTIGTKNLMKEALDDNYRIQTDLAKRQNKRMNYTAQDVDKIQELIKVQEYNKQKCVYNRKNNKITITVVDNGHIFGSCSFYVSVKDSSGKVCNIFFSGDYKRSHEFFNVKKIPKGIRKSPVTIVCESTYGTTYSDDIKPVFEKNICNLFSDDFYTTGVIPVFSLDRAQKILYILKCMQKRGVLDKSIPIYYDGNLSLKYTGMIQKYPKDFNLKGYMVDFLPENCIFVNKDLRESIVNDLESKKLIVTTSGMGTFGPAQFYIPRLISHDNCFIHFVGHQEPNTIGGKLLSSSEYDDFVNLNGVMKPRKAKILDTAEMSSHATADQLIKLLGNFNNLQCVLINHGEQDVKEEFAKAILNDKTLNPKDIGVFDGFTIFRISPYGMVKVMSVNTLK